MNSPQIEDGYTRIANELMEQVPKYKLNGTQLRLILVIWRYTYGFKRKEHEFSLSFLAEALQTSRSQVDRELTALIERNIVKVTGISKNRSRILMFNKHYSEWLNERRAPSVNVLENENTVSSKTSTTSTRSSKKKKKSARHRRTYAESDTYYKMAVYFHGKVKKMSESIGFNHASIAKADMQKWADEFRKIVEIDGVKDKRLIRDVIDWVTADPFWQVNVISAKKLREKFPDLVFQFQKSKRKRRQQNQSMIDRLAAAQAWIEAGGDPYEFQSD